MSTDSIGRLWADAPVAVAERHEHRAAKLHERVRHGHLERARPRSILDDLARPEVRDGNSVQAARARRGYRLSMAPEIIRASTHPDWPRAIASIERETLETATCLSRFARQMRAHRSGDLTASDLYLTEVVYQKARRMLRRAIRHATPMLRRRHSRWGAASLLCALTVDALERDTVDPSIVVAIQVDVTRWTLEQYDGGAVISM